MDKVDSMQEQIGDVSVEMEILKKNYKEHCNRNVYDGLASQLDTNERISALQDASIETFTSKKLREERLGKKKKEHPRTVGQLYKV